MTHLWSKQWYESLPIALGGIVTSNSIAIMASIDWGAWFTAAALALTAIGGAILSLWRQYQLTLIELREKERALADARAKGVLVLSTASATGSPGSPSSP